MSAPPADPQRGQGNDVHLEATASELGRVYQAGRDLTVYETVLPAEVLRPVAEVDAPSGLVYLPERPNIFVGRETDLARLEEALSTAGGVVVQAVHGLGGIGKSTLAAHYAATRADDLNPVWWVNADSPAAIEAGLAGAGDQTSTRTDPGAADRGAGRTGGPMADLPRRLAAGTGQCHRPHPHPPTRRAPVIRPASGHQPTSDRLA